MMEPTRLNLGAGSKPLPGFQSIDIATGQAAYPLAGYADGSVAELYASHLLEHFPRAQTLAVLREWFRALAPGGRLRVAVPDMDRIVEAYIVKSPGADVDGWLMGGQTSASDVHLNVFNEPKLRALLEAAGFVNVCPWTAEIADCASLPVSLNLQGTKPLVPADFHARRETFQRQLVAIHRASAKPEPPPPPPLKVTSAAVISCGRVIFSAQFGCTYASLPVLGMPLIRGYGAYWGQSMELAMTNAIRDHDPEYLVSLDWDSLFTPADIRAEIALMDAHPEVGALCPLQWHRTEPKPLFTPLRNSDGTFIMPTEAELAGDLLEIGTGHFGLTVIRTSALARMPHPWFYSYPAPEGTWTVGKLDDDMYFWYLFRECGNRLFLAPQIAIGHEVETIVWPGADLQQAVPQGMFDYLGRGKPEGVFGRGPAV